MSNNLLQEKYAIRIWFAYLLIKINLPEPDDNEKIPITF